MAKILVVDDDKSIIDILSTILSRSGHEVVVGMDGKEGLAAAKEHKPDLIILDVMMPVMDGFTVSGLMFQDPVLRKIPVLILTAQGHSRDLFELVPNVRLYMPKPFDPKDLLEKVQQLLQARFLAA